MRFGRYPQFRTPPKEYSAEWMGGFLAELKDVLDQNQHISECLSFGNGTDYDNILGKWMSYSTNAVANTEDELSHNLGATPTSFIVMKPPATGVVNIGTTSWSDSKLYLKCSGAAQTAVIFVMIQGHEDAE